MKYFVTTELARPILRTSETKEYVCATQYETAIRFHTRLDLGGKANSWDGEPVANSPVHEITRKEYLELKARG